MEPIRERGKRGRFIKHKDQVGEFRSDSTSDIPTDDRASPPVRAMVQANKLPTAGDVEIAMQMIEDTLTPDGHSSANDADKKPHNAELVPIAKGNGRANEVQSNTNSMPKDAVSARDSGQPSATSIVRTTKRLYVCDGCFKYMKQPAIYNSHKVGGPKDLIFAMPTFNGQLSDRNDAPIPARPEEKSTKRERTPFGKSMGLMRRYAYICSSSLRETVPPDVVHPHSSSMPSACACSENSSLITNTFSSTWKASPFTF